MRAQRVGIADKKPIVEMEPDKVEAGLSGAVEPEAEPLSVAPDAADERHPRGTLRKLWMELPRAAVGGLG